jgi:hypothetical protein
MKNTKWMLAVSLVALSSVVWSQSMGKSGVKAQVPFDFTAGNKTIPAGECVVQSSNMDGNVLLIRNAEAKASLLIMSSATEAKGGSADTVLVFERYGDRYFLSSIRVQGSDRIYRLPRSKAESELRAQNASATEQTLLASLK